MHCYQKTFTLAPYKRGFHIITTLVEREIPEMKNISAGLAHIFIHHTSAGLTINENADPSVRTDFESHLNLLVPENADHYQHNEEGPDDMPAHIKSSMMGSAVTIPITKGKFNMGVWQGIYLTEHRNHASGRKITITVIGS